MTSKVEKVRRRCSPRGLVRATFLAATALIVLTGHAADRPKLNTWESEVPISCGACGPNRIDPRKLATFRTKTSQTPVAGTRRILIIRVDFPDLTGSPITNKAQAVDLFYRPRGVRDFYNQCSY